MISRTSFLLIFHYKMFVKTNCISTLPVRGQWKRRHDCILSFSFRLISWKVSLKVCKMCFFNGAKVVFFFKSFFDEWRTYCLLWFWNHTVSTFHQILQLHMFLYSVCFIMSAVLKFRDAFVCFLMLIYSDFLLLNVALCVLLLSCCDWQVNIILWKNLH